MPSAGQGPDRTVPPPGAVRAQVRSADDSLSVMVRFTDTDLVRVGGAETVGGGGGVVSRTQVTVVVEVFPAGSVAVTTRV